MQVVLYQPQIPQNTGNIARTCAVTGVSLRLVAPLGFQIHERELKRAGLDYWHLLDIQLIEDAQAWLLEYQSKCIFFSSKAKVNYTQVSYSCDSILIFGSETCGLPSSWLQQWPEQTVRIPMIEQPNARCLNLATSVGIGLYEALRQTGFTKMS